MKNANDNLAFQGQWEHMEMEGGGILSVCVVPEDAEMKRGEALLLTDDPDAFEVSTFREVMNRWRGLCRGERISAFVHGEDLADFKSFLPHR